MRWLFGWPGGFALRGTIHLVAAVVDADDLSEREEVRETGLLDGDAVESEETPDNRAEPDRIDDPGDDETSPPSDPEPHDRSGA